jgi:hypothetical protein
LFGNATIDGPQDHEVLLDGRQAVDPFIEGICLMLNRDQAKGLGNAALLENVVPQMAV